MRSWLHGRRWSVAILAISLAGLTGCQTWVPGVGMTLPSGHYLQHRPQYFPPSPAFPLSKELATMEANNAAAGPPLPGPGPAPAPVVPGPIGP
jgi:hypothetical protein